MKSVIRCALAAAAISASGAVQAADHFNERISFGTQESVRLRLGYSADHFLGFDRALLYIAGGWSRARISSTDFFYRDGDGSLTFGSSRERDGWNIGVGADIPLS